MVRTKRPSQFLKLSRNIRTGRIDPNRARHLNLKLSAVWRSETADFAYAGNNALAGTSGGDDPFVGRAAALSLAWRPNDNVLINPYVSYVAVSDDLISRGAHDVTYAHLSVTLRF